MAAYLGEKISPEIRTIVVNSMHRHSELTSRICAYVDLMRSKAILRPEDDLRYMRVELGGGHYSILRDYVAETAREMAMEIVETIVPDLEKHIEQKVRNRIAARIKEGQL